MAQKDTYIDLEREKTFINKQLQLNLKITSLKKKFQKYICQTKEKSVKTDICNKTE